MGGTGRLGSLIKKDVGQPKLVRPKNILRYAFILSTLCLTTFYCGYCLAYITALGSENLEIVYGKTTKIPVVKAFLISCIPFGVTFGTFLNPWILPLQSRRNLTLILSFIAQILQFIILIPNLGVFFTVRFLQGIITGLFLALIPAYVRQLSPKEINKRGIFGIFGQLFVIFGFMMAFGFNTILLESGVDQFLRWRIVVSINFFVILIIIISIITKIIPESPNSLIPKGKIEDAKNVIALFHRQNCVEQVYEQKLKQIEDAKKPPAPPTQDKSIIKTILAFQIPIMHQLTGVNAYISQMGFVTAAFNNKFGEFVPFLMGAVQVITAIYALIFLKRVNRRTLVLVGNFGMSICCIGIGISYVFINDFKQMFWVVVALIIIFMAIHGATLIPGVWMYVPELATKQQIRWSQVTNWFACSSSVVLFITIGQYFGYQYIFLTFGVVTMICFIFNAMYMMEIKPKLKEIVKVELAKIQFNTSQTSERNDNFQLNQ